LFFWIAVGSRCRFSSIAVFGQSFVESRLERVSMPPVRDRWAAWRGATVIVGWPKKQDEKREDTDQTEAGVQWWIGRWREGGEKKRAAKVSHFSTSLIT